jgi:hypothetical protein
MICTGKRERLNANWKLFEIKERQMLNTSTIPVTNQNVEYFV